MQINYRRGRKGVPALQYLSDVLKEFCFGDRTTKTVRNRNANKNFLLANELQRKSLGQFADRIWLDTYPANAYPEQDLHFKESSVSKRTFILQKPARRQHNTP